MNKKNNKTVAINGYEYKRVMLNIGVNEKGRQIQKPFYGKTIKEAKAKKEAYKQNMLAGLNLSKESLYKAMYIWLWEIVKYDVAPPTFERYEIILRCHIKKADIALMKMTNITDLDIKRYLNKLYDSGKTISHITNIYKLLRKFFIYAFNEGHIKSNVCKNVKPPKSYAVENDDDMVISSDEEIKTMYTSDDEQIKFIALFALVSGLREGEILALNETDISGNIIDVHKTVKNVKIFDGPDKWHYELKVSIPKTKCSVRKVPLPSSFIPILQKIFDYNKELHKLSIEKKNLLFPSTVGGYIDEANLRKAYIKYLNKLGIPYRTFHNLRHPYVKYTPKNNLGFFRKRQCGEEESGYFNPYNLSIAFLVINHTLPLFR
jgi:integrase